MKYTATMRDVQVACLIGSAIFLMGLVQGLVYTNPYRVFEPHLFIHVYALAGGLTWFLMKKSHVFRIEHAVILLVLIRVTMIVMQVVAFSAWGFYNERNEVAYYQHLARVLVDPSFFSLYQNVKYGIPPGFQFWLLSYQVLFFQNTTGILRDSLFSLLNVAFEAGTLLVMIKIARSEKFEAFTCLGKGHRAGYLKAGILFYTISMFNVYYSNVRNFMEPVPIFLAVTGLFFFIQGKHGRAALFLSMSTMLKFIPIFWLLLIILHRLKKRDVKTVASYVGVSGCVAGTGFVLSAVTYQEHVVDYFLAFFPRFYDWSTLAGEYLQLNQALWYPVYSPVFFLAGLGILGVVAVVIACKERGELPLHGFTSIASLYFIFQPWFDQRYFLWILPLLCLDLQGSRKHFTMVVVLFFISVYLYLGFMHPVVDLEISTTFSNDPFSIGAVYRATGLVISYAGFGLVCGRQLASTFKHNVFPTGALTPVEMAPE